MSLEIFRSYKLVLAALFIKLKNNFPRLYFRTSLCCHFGIFKNQQSLSEPPTLLAPDP